MLTMIKFLNVDNAEVTSTKFLTPSESTCIHVVINNGSTRRLPLFVQAQEPLSIFPKSSKVSSAYPRHVMCFEYEIEKADWSIVAQLTAKKNRECFMSAKSR